MASEHDLDLVTRIGAGTATGVLGADDPDQVAEAVSRTLGAVRVDVDALPCAVAGARVRLAEVVVARARQAELDVAAEVGRTRRPAEPAADRAVEDGPDADRQAVRFALVILVLALLGGIAVYLADGLVLAPVLPAAALLVLAVVVLVHRGPAGAPVGEPAPAPSGDVVEVDVGDAPVVRAAEAHLRRQQAAWKLAWWEREEPVPDLARWSPGLGPGVPITLLAVDPAGELDPATGATMTATAPAAVRVVVLQRRG